MGFSSQISTLCAYRFALCPSLVAVIAILMMSLASTIQSAINTGPALLKKDQCEVCHNTRNPHTVLVNCNKVADYLANHPGDYEGPCADVTPEKPPKPPKHPKADSTAKG